jgi:hypothetical protein
MHSLIKIENEKAKEIIQTYQYDTILGFLFDLTRGNQLHKKRYSKKEAFETVESAETVVLNADDDFSIMSLYSVLQENEREIKAEGTKLDLIVLGLSENLFENIQKGA